MPSAVVTSAGGSAHSPSVMNVEQWGVYDISPTSTDPTALLPVFLLRSELDNELYLEFANSVDPASSPPSGEWGVGCCRRDATVGHTWPIARAPVTLAGGAPTTRHCAPALSGRVQSYPPPASPVDAIDVYNAWYESGTPYSNVATQGTRDPAGGDDRCGAGSR